MKRTVTVVVLVFVLSLVALAHGNEKHVMGMVTSISESSITIEATTKKSVTIEISNRTKFEKSGTRATWKELKVGDKAVVHADVAGDKLVANKVRFGTKKAAAAKGTLP